MKQKVTLFFLVVCPLLLAGLPAAAQQIPHSIPKRDSLDSLPALPSPKYNAGFDVMIKTNGDFVYGLVQEVGPYQIRYKRTDIPDGPVYTIDRREVFAISYRNQLKEVLNPVMGMPPQPWPGQPYPGQAPRRQRQQQPPYHRPYPPQPGMQGYPNNPPMAYPPAYPYPPQGMDPQQYPYPYDPTMQQPVKRRNQFSLSRMPMLRFGIGFFRGYTKVSDADAYASSFTFPTLSLAYEVQLQPSLRVGVQAALGQNKFSRQELNDYDSLRINRTLKENLFSLHAYGRYSIGDRFARLQPYLTLGAGFHSSFVRSDQQISFLERNSNMPALQVESGSRSVSLGILARAGADYYINPQFRAFADVGTGPAVLQLGIAAFID